MKNTKNKIQPTAEPLTAGELAAIRQQSNYNDEGKSAPDNNIFFEEKSNPLSSKGN